MKHPGHTYGGFVPAISEWGMTEIARSDGHSWVGLGPILTYRCRAVMHV
jgi:hypothetical protein